VVLLLLGPRAAAQQLLAHALQLLVVVVVLHRNGRRARAVQRQRRGGRRRGRDDDALLVRLHVRALPPQRRRQNQQQEEESSSQQQEEESSSSKEESSSQEEESQEHKSPRATACAAENRRPGAGTIRRSFPASGVRGHGEAQGTRQRQEADDDGRGVGGHGGGEALEQPLPGLPQLDDGDGAGAAHRQRGEDGGAPGVVPLAQLAAPPPGHPCRLRGRLGGRLPRGRGMTVRATTATQIVMIIQSMVWTATYMPMPQLSCMILFATEILTVVLMYVTGSILHDHN
jgi:hypothetical protein